MNNYLKANKLEEVVSQEVKDAREMAERAALNEAVESNEIPGRFHSLREVKVYYEDSLVALEKTEAGKAVSRKLPWGETLRTLIEGSSNVDLPTRAAGLAQEAGVGDAQAGTLAHKASELKTLFEQPTEILSGERRVEQKITLRDGGFGEIDEVIVRGDKHYIRDLKPFHLDRFERTVAGERWANWMRRSYGEDFREQIRRGNLNPFGEPRDRSGLDHGAWKELQNALKKEGEIHQRHQLEAYADAYADIQGVERSQVTGVVRWYWKI